MKVILTNSDLLLESIVFLLICWFSNLFYPLNTLFKWNCIQEPTKPIQAEILWLKQPQSPCSACPFVSGTQPTPTARPLKALQGCSWDQYSTVWNLMSQAIGHSSWSHLSYVSGCPSNYWPSSNVPYSKPTDPNRLIWQLCSMGE